MSRDNNYFRKKLFKPSTIRKKAGSPRVSNLSLSSQAQNSFGNMSPTSSFMFDPAGSGLRNTQQLNVDFSKFENHTFFNSARNKSHVAIEKIINTFPFDGSRKDHELFLNGLTGFEKYVFDQYPKNVGFLIFSRSSGDNGNYLTVDDFSKKKNQSGKIESSAPVLDFSKKPFSIECSLFIPLETNHNEVIAQRLQDSNRGFTLALSASSGNEADLIFSVSNQEKQIDISTPLRKGRFNHIAAVYDKGETDKLKIYVNGSFKAMSSLSANIENIDFINTTFNIGTGSLHKYKGESFLPNKSLHGYLDEFRFFKSARSSYDIREYLGQELYAQDDLDLYFRFNEPSGTFSKNGLGNSSLVLDYSGNGLHTHITNFDINLRDTGSIARDFPSIHAEDPSKSPILFPAHTSVQSFATNLIATASSYDLNNPNLITKMVPRHYMTDAAIFEGIASNDGDLSKPPKMSADQPGGNSLNQAQIISSILFTWANTFDEIKMFIGELSRVLKVDYLDDQTISDHLLPFLAHYHGFSLPSQFNSTTLEQLSNGRKLTAEETYSNLTLQTIQNTIWRRILADLPEIRRTKGTHASFRSILINMGINPDGPFRIREYGGSNNIKLGSSVEKRREVSSMLNFSGTISPQGALDGTGKDLSRPLLLSPFLSASRTAPGHPHPAGTITSHGSTAPGDGLFTSGSWTVEGVFKFESKYKHRNNQSLFRIQTTGSEGNVTNNWLLFNVVATGRDITIGETGSLTLYGKPNSGSQGKELRVYIPGINVLDGNKWHVSFGRKRNDETDYHQSSSYFLRAGKREIGNTVFSSSYEYFYDTDPSPLNILTASNNASGAFIAVGSMSLDYDTTSDIKHLNTSQYSLGNYVDFSGKVCNLRFFSKALEVKETLSHVENFKSVGVLDPSVNFNFTPKNTGSFERLRVDMSLDQPVTDSSGDGTMTAFDFSQNLFHGLGTGFEKDAKIIEPETFNYLVYSPKFESANTTNKIRIRSFKEPSLADREGTLVAPLTELPRTEIPTDDRRFEIEISSVQALNEDIMNIFGTLEFFDNAIGSPELAFSHDYKDIRSLRRVYFNRLTDKISLKKFFEFFKWFDSTVGDVFEELIPRSARYLGTNFVVESHALERPKFEYKFFDMYVGPAEKTQKNQIFMNQFVAEINVVKF